MSTKGSLLKRFRQLNKPPDLMVGEIITVDGSDNYTVQLDYGGGVINARGKDYAINDRVYVRNGIIESKASSHIVQIIEV